MKKIVFALFPLFFLAGCFSFENSKISEISSLENIVQKQREIKEEQSAYFSLEKSLKSEKKYNIILNNPKNLPIQTLKFSLAYPSHLAKISKFTNLSDEYFPLLLEKKNEKGIFTVSMGRDGKALPLDNTLMIGTIFLENISDSPFQLSFFNGEKGNSIMMVKENEVINILNIEKLKNITVE